tara:strand:+ start:126 stop:425 length:300 start_codon:yes stop_codon:yes gene_type:complete
MKMRKETIEKIQMLPLYAMMLSLFATLPTFAANYTDLLPRELLSEMLAIECFMVVACLILYPVFIVVTEYPRDTAIAICSGATLFSVMYGTLWICSLFI